MIGPCAGRLKAVADIERLRIGHSGSNAEISIVEVTRVSGAEVDRPDQFIRHDGNGALAFTLAVSVRSRAAFGQVRPQFLPTSSTPLFYLNSLLSQGTDIRAALRAMQTIEQLVLTMDEVTAVTTLLGRGASRFILTNNHEQPDPSYGRLIVQTTRVDDASLGNCRTIDRKWHDLSCQLPRRRLTSIITRGGPIGFVSPKNKKTEGTANGRRRRHRFPAIRPGSEKL